MSMDFAFSETAHDVQEAVGRWVDKQQRRGRTDAFDLARWQSFLGLGILDDDPDTLFDRCVGLMEAARAGLPGPVLEAQLALAADRSGQARALLAKGAVVSSVHPGKRGPTLVGWGGAADLVIDQSSGAVAASAPLPAGQFSYPVPHGWLDKMADSVGDGHAVERWLYGSVLLSGLCQGAIELTAEYVRVREQFGAPLASYQAIQFPLAEAKILADGVRFSALDAAQRIAHGRPHAAVSAALAWLAATQTAERITRTCHQSFGSTGFTYETGLVDLTWGMSWLRLTVGNKGAQKFLAAARRLGRAQRVGAAPGCLVLEGFADIGNPGARAA